MCHRIVPESERQSTEAVEGARLTLLVGGTTINIQRFSIDRSDLQ